MKKESKRKHHKYVGHASHEQVRKGLLIICCICFAVVLLRSILSAFETPSAIQFRDVHTAGGLTFTLENSPTSEKHLPETMAGGVAAFDYDGDGLIDIFFTNGALMPSLQKSGPQYSNRLYRNMGGMQFRDVTAAAGLAGRAA